MTTTMFVLRDIRWVDFELQAIITKIRKYLSSHYKRAGFFEGALSL